MVGQAAILRVDVALAEFLEKERTFMFGKDDFKKESGIESTFIPNFIAN